MKYLIISIVLTTSLLIVFKYFNQYKISLLYSLIGNYFACIVIGLSIGLSSEIQSVAMPFHLIFLCLMFGVLFFTVLYAIAFASGEIGVGITGAATKMSFIIPVIASAIFFNESLLNVQIFSCFLALLAIYLMTIDSEGVKFKNKLKVPLFIWIGSGIIDFLLGVLKSHLQFIGLNQNIAIVFIFSGACTLALLVVVKRKEKLKLSHLMIGVPLGVINYFSIHFLLLALGSGELTFQLLYMINNSVIVVLSFVLGLILFKEVINWQKAIGLALCLLSIFVMMKSS